MTRAICSDKLPLENITEVKWKIINKFYLLVIWNVYSSSSRNIPTDRRRLNPWQVKTSWRQIISSAQLLSTNQIRTNKIIQNTFVTA
jgi:hypothetical protein